MKEDVSLGEAQQEAAIYLAYMASQGHKEVSFVLKNNVDESKVVRVKAKIEVIEGAEYLTERSLIEDEVSKALKEKA